MKSVVVAPDYFGEIVFKGSQPKMVTFENGAKVANPYQKTRKDSAGQAVPVWTVKVAVSVESPNGRTDDDFITVSVPSDTDPADHYRRGEDVQFDRLQFGVADTRTGYSLWFSADAIHPAAVGSRAVAAATA